MSDQPKTDAFVKFGELARTWGQQYEDDPAFSGHSANRYRLAIALSLLADRKPSSVIDVGCGSGEPLIAMLRRGYQVRGFDYSDQMVEQARDNLRRAGFPEDLVFRDNMEDLATPPAQAACVVALGSLYYARDFHLAVRNVVSLMAPGGDVIVSLRNELFSLFSLNRGTIDFVERRLVPQVALTDSTRAALRDYLTDRLGADEQGRAFQTVDDIGVHSLFHNPLTVERDVLSPAGLVLRGLYFYHFHALPPAFEHRMPQEFRRLSASMEVPTDWRGLFMASAFVVHAQRPAAVVSAT